MFYVRISYSLPFWLTDTGIFRIFNSIENCAYIPFRRPFHLGILRLLRFFKKNSGLKTLIMSKKKYYNNPTDFCGIMLIIQ